MKEMDEYKKPKKKDAPKNIQDDLDYQWKVNPLAEDRVPGTERQAHPDTAREPENDVVNNYGNSKKKPLLSKAEKGLSGDKTVKNLRDPHNDEDMDEYDMGTNRYAENSSMRTPNPNPKNTGSKTNRSKAKDEEDSDYTPSPYDQHGNVKDKDQESNLENDPLKLIKMKLRQDFSNKIKDGSSMKQA